MGDVLENLTRELLGTSRKSVGKIVPISNTKEVSRNISKQKAGNFYQIEHVLLAGMTPPKERNKISQLQVM